jgi:predicted Zn-dependent protease
MHLAAQACYDPQTAQQVFQQMKTGSNTAGQQVPEFVSTHHSHDSGIQHMDQRLPETRRIWKQDEGELLDE